MTDCSKCIHENYDCIWHEDLEDEIPLYTCEKGHSIDENCNCEDYIER